MRTENFECYVVQENARLRDAMILIEENRHRTLVVVDADMKVVGTLSDGDTRRAVLQERLLDTKVCDVMNTHFLFVRDDQDEMQARAFMEREHVFMVPVLDEFGRITSLHLAY